MQIRLFALLNQQKLLPDCFEGLFSTLVRFKLIIHEMLELFMPSNVGQIFVSFRLIIRIQGPKLFNTLNPDITEAPEYR
jgi:hypothetical protein